jgi:acyl-CoA synthetase (AMP-forming)/AMP-acid ligase II
VDQTTGTLRGADLGRLLDFHARSRPHAVALTDAGARLDFAEIDRRVKRLARALADAGVGPGDRVALRLPDSHRHHLCLFACARLGAVFVPLPQALAGDALERAVRDCGAALRLEDAAAFDALIDAAPAGSPGAQPRADADTPLAILYTSGTTGAPKGVVLTHGNVLATVFNQILGWGLGAADRALVVAPLHHAGGLLALGLPCLCAGGAMHLAVREPQAALEAIERERVSAVFLPPALWQRVAEATPEAAAPEPVRICASGGDPVPVAVIERIRAAFGGEFTDAFGMTETASAVTLLHDAERRPGSAGVPLPLTRVRILAEDGRDAIADEIGEIAVSGPTVMQGYWNRPAETAAALPDDWLRTGDLGRLDPDGFLHVAGRRSDLIPCGGATVYPAAIERVLRDHPDIAEAAVVGVPDADLGQVAVAVVVARAGVRLEPAAVLEFCRGRLAGGQCPRRAFLCDALPRNANGKVAKAVLQATYRGAA